MSVSGRRRQSPWAVATFTLLFLLASTGIASAHWKAYPGWCPYAGQSLRWPTRNLNYWVPQWNSYPKDLNAVVNAANNMGNNTDINLSRKYDKPANIEWGRAYKNYNGWDAQSVISYNFGACQIFYVSVTINRTYTDSYSQAKTQSATVHEFGHSIGMNHFTDGCRLRSIMQDGTPCRWGTLGINTVQSHDINDINAHY